MFGISPGTRIKMVPCTECDTYGLVYDKENYMWVTCIVCQGTGEIELEIHDQEYRHSDSEEGE